MSRDKQIEEMAKDINVADHEYCNGRCLDCGHKARVTEDYTCVDRAIAAALVNKGYRKASEVAEEIFAEIDKVVYQLMNNLNYSIGEAVYDLAELKKKYTEGGE